ncbi:MAG TPA: mechanosensitive ion channel family protein [Oscillatoriales cyanobacterium M59_W2019_021]|nr:mechanosensitive ion channel family protein [Oscillatoriales cyanobacterium M4454_W2019_049]HIK50853.1 mechanosensitive ion channel family protein [Oscillatoriales cyanobacterium M59_W2019_021]
MTASVLEIVKIVIPIALVALGFVGGYVFEHRVLKRLKSIADRTGWQGYNIILSSLRGMTLLWFAIAGIFAATLSISLEPWLDILLQKILLALLLGSATIVIARLAVGFIQFYGGRGEDTSPLTSLFENLTKLVIFSLGILIIIQSLGISITPLLTALGIGGVSIGLALQNTLSNLFSGLNIILSKKVRPGDYIQLEPDEEGYVTDVAWRYTVIRDIPGNLIVIPNSKIVSSTLKNYTLPERSMLLPLEVGVSYESDLERVEAVTLEVAREVMAEVPGGVPDYDPLIRYRDFGYFSINFIIYLKIKEFYDHLIVRHEFIKRLHRRYRLENIELPFPIRSGYVPEQGDPPFRFPRGYSINSSPQKSHRKL